MVEYMAKTVGEVYYVGVKPGDKIKAGMTLVSVEAMKVQTSICATVDGTVKEVKVKENDMVNLGDVLLTTE